MTSRDPADLAFSDQVDASTRETARQNTTIEDFFCGQAAVWGVC